MNKNELSNIVAEKCNIPLDLARTVVTSVFDTIIETVSEGETIKIMGFGTFEAKERAAKSGINPATKERISIPGRKAPVFKSGKQFKGAVNK